MPPFTYSIQPDGLYLQSEQGVMALTPYTERAIRVRFTLRPEFSAQASLMVVAEPDQSVPFTVNETLDSLLFATAEVTIAIDRRTVAFTYLDRRGVLLTKEPARGGKTLTPVDVELSAFADSTVAEISRGVARRTIVRTYPDRGREQPTVHLHRWKACGRPITTNNPLYAPAPRGTL